MKTKKNKEKVDLKNKDISSKKNNNKKHYIFTKEHIVSTSIILAVSLLLGGGGGFLFYRWMNPQSASLSPVGFEGYVPAKEEIDKSLAKDSLIADYKDKYYQLVNYSLSLQSSYKYSLTIGKAKVVSSGVTQSIQSCNYTTPEVIYNQNVSSSSLVKTANRFYDYYDNKVSCYLQSVPEDWKKGSSPIEYSYDEYMQKYGKLLQSSYYCTATTDLSEVTEANPVADRYLTSDKKVFQDSLDKTKHHVNGVIIYLVGPNSVKKSTFEKKGDGYHATMDLYTDQDKKNNSDPNIKITTGNSYYSVQMRSTGGLASRPLFTKTHLEFELDSSLHLVSSYFYDEYTAVVGPINSPATSEMTQYYFHSDSDTFDSVKVKVPSCSEGDTFNGYELFPKGV